MENDKNIIDSKKQKRDSDTEFAQRYFTLLVGQYRIMSRKVDDPQALAEAEEIAKIPVPEITWEQIYRFELAILMLQPFEALRRRAWILREEYQEVASPLEYAEYIKSNPPDPNDPKVIEADLRSDLVRIQEELNWAYTILWVEEEFRSKLTRSVIGVTLCGIAVFAGCLAISGGFSTRLTLLAVIFGGMVGGCVTTVRRIQKAELQGNADLNLITLERGRLSIYLSPFLGGVFSVVLYLLFASGYIKSGLFPDFTSNGELLYGIFPSLQGTELAKLLVWSFIAGFAEQFVPDRLSQLIKEGEEDKKRRDSSPS
jgi:hypothetical protein